MGIIKQLDFWRFTVILFAVVHLCTVVSSWFIFVLKIEGVTALMFKQISSANSLWFELKALGISLI